MQLLCVLPCIVQYLMRQTRRLLRTRTFAFCLWCTPWILPCSNNVARCQAVCPPGPLIWQPCAIWPLVVIPFTHHKRKALKAVLILSVQGMQLAQDLHDCYQVRLESAPHGPPIQGRQGLLGGPLSVTNRGHLCPGLPVWFIFGESERIQHTIINISRHQHLSHSVHVDL